jgi:translocation and assembly module TamA
MRSNGTRARATTWLIAIGVAVAPLSVQAARVSTDLDGIGGDLKAAALAGLDLAQYATRDVSDAQVRRLYESAPEQIARALEPYGYYDVDVVGELTETPQGWRAVLHVKSGDPVTVAALDLRLDGPAAELRPVRAAVRAFAPQVGQPLDHAAYERGKTAIHASLFASGFLDAALVSHKVTFTRATRRATIELAWEPGRRYRIGATVFEGGQFAPEFLTRYVPYKEGDYYTQEALLGLQQRLVDADYFAIVDVNPDIEHASDGVVPVAVKLAPAKRSVYTGGVFVGTDTGFGVRGGVERRWLNRRGHKIKTEAIVAQRLQTVSALYAIPLPGPDNRSFNYGINYRDEDTESTRSKTASLVANETIQWKGFTRTLGVHLLTGDFEIGKREEGGIEGHSTILYPEAGLTRKNADDPLFVRRGYSLSLVGRAAAEGLVSDTDFVQLRADAKWIRGIGWRQRVILRGTLGTSLVGDFDALPPPLRFFAGGDRSIRGYGYQAVGPRVVVSDKFDPLVIGGRNLIVASAEYEYYFRRKWGIATFVDAGDAFSGSGFALKTGVGLGLRWRSPVGMVRVDVGVPVGDRYNDSPQLHLVIGPDL